MFVQTQAVEASEQFGRAIHGIAVVIAREGDGGKSLLARKIGKEKKVIQFITSGRAHELLSPDHPDKIEPEVLDLLVTAVTPYVRPKTMGYLNDLAQKIKAGN